MVYNYLFHFYEMTILKSAIFSESQLTRSNRRRMKVKKKILKLKV